MKAIARFLLLLLLVCGTALAWKSSDRRFRHYAADEGAQQKAEADSLAALLQPLQSPGRVRLNAQPNVWSKAEFQGHLEEAFQKNDPCAVLELLRNTRDAAPREFWSAGMAVLLSQGRDKHPQLLELLANPDSPLYGQPREDAKSQEARFFTALILSGQLRSPEDEESGRRHGLRNFEKAIELFKALAAEDPDNGAHSYFLAGALKQSGAKKEEVHAAYGAAAKAARFEPFYQSISDALQTAAYANVATFAWAHAFLEWMPSPDYEVGTKYLKYWAHNEEPGKWIAFRLAKRLVEVGTRYKTHSPGYDFSRSEYLLGQNLKYTVEGRQERSWEDYVNKMREAQDFISESPKPVTDSQSSLYRDRIETKPSCGPDAWKSLYAAYKAKSAGA